MALPLHIPGDPVLAVATYGSAVATGTMYGEVQFWNWDNTAKTLTRSGAPDNVGGAVCGLAFNAAGSVLTIAGASGVRTVRRVWDAHVVANTGDVAVVAAGPGDRVAFAVGKQVGIYDPTPDAGEAVITAWAGAKANGTISRLVWGGDRLAAVNDNGSGNSEITRWEVTANPPTTKQNDSNKLSMLAVSAAAIVGVIDATGPTQILIWPRGDATPPSPPLTLTGPTPVTAIAATDDRVVIARGAELASWKFDQSDKKTISLPAGQTVDAMDTDGNKVWVAGSSKLYEFAPEIPSLTEMGEVPDGVMSVAVHAGTNRVLYGFQGAKDAEVYPLTGPGTMRVLAGSKDFALQLTGDGTHAVAHDSVNKKLLRWPLDRMASLSTDGPYYAAAASADEAVPSVVAVAGKATDVLLFRDDVPATKAVAATDSRAAAVSADGAWVAVGGLGQTIEVFKALDGSSAKTKPVGKSVAALGFNNGTGDTRLAMGDVEANVHTWKFNASTNQNLIEPKTTATVFGAPAKAVAFRPGGRFAAVGGDGQVVVWTDHAMSNTGKVVGALFGAAPATAPEEGSAYAVAWLADDAVIVGASDGIHVVQV